MFRDDDDDLKLSESDSRRYAGDNKLKALEQKMRDQGKDLAARPLTEDKSKFKLSVLKQNLEGKKDDQTKKDQDKKQPGQPKGFGTRTREQEITREQSTSAADVRPDAENLQKQDARAQTVKDEQQKEGEVQGDEPA